MYFCWRLQHAHEFFYSTDGLYGEVLPRAFTRLPEVENVKNLPKQLKRKVVILVTPKQCKRGGGRVTRQDGRLGVLVGPHTEGAVCIVVVESGYAKSGILLLEEHRVPHFVEVPYFYGLRPSLKFPIDKASLTHMLKQIPVKYHWSVEGKMKFTGTQLKAIIMNMSRRSLNQYTKAVLFSRVWPSPTQLLRWMTRRNHGMTQDDIDRILQSQKANCIGCDKSRLYEMGPVVHSTNGMRMLVRIGSLTGAIDLRFKEPCIRLLSAKPPVELLAQPAIPCTHNPLAVCKDCACPEPSDAQSMLDHNKTVMEAEIRRHQEDIAKYPDGTVENGKFLKLGVVNAIEVNKILLETRMHIILARHFIRLGHDGIETFVSNLPLSEQRKFEEWSQEIVKKKIQERKRKWNELSFVGRLPKCMSGQANHLRRVQYAGIVKEVRLHSPELADVVLEYLLDRVEQEPNGKDRRRQLAAAAASESKVLLNVAIHMLMHLLCLCIHHTFVFISHMFYLAFVCCTHICFYHAFVVMRPAQFFLLCIGFYYTKVFFKFIMLKITFIFVGETRYTEMQSPTS